MGTELASELLKEPRALCSSFRGATLRVIEFGFAMAATALYVGAVNSLVALRLALRLSSCL